MMATRDAVELRAKREQARKARKALAYKERRELRPAFWAGLVIFVGLPLLWSVILILVDPKYTPLPGVATAVWLIGGWLYGSVVGAQSVCRDFGRATGSFLVAMPVTRGQIVEAKVYAGLRVLLILSAIITMIEVLSLSFGIRIRVADPISYAAIAAALPFFTWLFAFIAASIVRNTLTAVVVAMSGLALVAAVPFVSARMAYWVWPWLNDAGVTLERVIDSVYYAYCRNAGIEHWDDVLFFTFHRRMTWFLSLAVVAVVGLFGFLGNQMRNGPDRRRSGPWRILLLASVFVSLAWADPKQFPFGAMVVIVIASWPVLSRAAAQFALRSERGLRVSIRALVCGLSALVVGVFVLAMGEAGANGKVSDIYWQGGQCKPIVGRDFAVRASSLPFFHSYFLSKDAGLLPWRVGPVWPLNDWLNTSVEKWTVVMDGDDAFYYVWIQFVEDPRLATPTGVYERRNLGTRSLWIARVDLDTGIAASAQPIPLPSNIDPRSLAGDFEAAIQGDHLYLMCYESSMEWNENGLCGNNNALAEYLLPDPLSPPIPLWEKCGSDFSRVIYEFRQDSQFVRGADQLLYLQYGNLAPLSVDAPLFDWRSAYRFEVGEISDFVTGYAASFFPIRKDLVAASSLWGISLIQEGIPGAQLSDPMKRPAKVIGKITASPWAALFRANQPRVLAGRSGQLWEIHEKSAVCYDISDPTQPRRILHVQTYPIKDAAAGEEFLLLEHEFGASVVLNPK